MAHVIVTVTTNRYMQAIPTTADAANRIITVLSELFDSPATDCERLTITVRDAE